MDAIEQEARQRFVRWDSNLWHELLQGPALRLAQVLPHDTALLDSYLRLASMGIGLGYLFPASAGLNFFTLAWTRLIPKYLADVPGPQRAAVLAELFNLAENLEKGPPWLRLVLVRQAETWDSLHDLEGRLAAVQAAALDAPAGSREVLHWVFLPPYDRRFLPGALHFVAPTILCVHERHVDPNATEVPTLGVWLAQDPLVLGAMGCQEAKLAVSRGAYIERLGFQDVRWSEVYASTGNAWRMAATLVTSQFLVVT